MVAYEQLKSFALFILNGILISIIFDFFRALRIAFKTSDIITYIEDIIFWIISGILSIFFIFIFSQGEIRNYTIMGIIIGIILYILLLSHFILIFLSRILTYMKNITLFIFKPFIYILKKLYLLSKRFCKSIL